MFMLMRFAHLRVANSHSLQIAVANSHWFDRSHFTHFTHRSGSTAACKVVRPTSRWLGLPNSSHNPRSGWFDNRTAACRPKTRIVHGIVVLRLRAPRPSIHRGSDGTTNGIVQPHRPPTKTTPCNNYKTLTSPSVKTHTLNTPQSRMMLPMHQRKNSRPAQHKI